MNIDERCYGYEPAQSQLATLRADLAAARVLLREVRDSLHEDVSPDAEGMALLDRIDAALAGEKK